MQSCPAARQDMRNRPTSSTEGGLRPARTLRRRRREVGAGLTASVRRECRIPGRKLKPRERISDSMGRFVKYPGRLSGEYLTASMDIGLRGDEVGVAVDVESSRPGRAVRSSPLTPAQRSRRGRTDRVRCTPGRGRS